MSGCEMDVCPRRERKIEFALNVVFPTWPQASFGCCYIGHTVDVVVQYRNSS